MLHRFSAVITREENLYVALCPELDVASQGVTLDGAVSNLKEAIELYLEGSEVEMPEEPAWLTFVEVAR